MRGAIFVFFALCLLLFLALLAGCHSDSTPGNYCCLLPLLCVFLWMYRLISAVFVSWTGNGQEWTYSWMDIRVCVVFSFSVFFVVACTKFICAVFIWALCVTTGWIFEMNSINQYAQNKVNVHTRADLSIFYSTFLLPVCVCVLFLRAPTF